MLVNTKALGSVAGHSIRCGASTDQRHSIKAQPLAALHTRDGTFQRPCNALTLHAMHSDAFSNMLEFLLPILE